MPLILRPLVAFFGVISIVYALFGVLVWPDFVTLWRSSVALAAAPRGAARNYPGPRGAAQLNNWLQKRCLRIFKLTEFKCATLPELSVPLKISAFN